MLTSFDEKIQTAIYHKSHQIIQIKDEFYLNPCFDWGRGDQNGLPQANQVDRGVVISSVYKDEANFSSQGEDDYLRMIYSPGDFSDLHMRPSPGYVEDTSNFPKDNDASTLPVIQGFISGFGPAPPNITLEFNVVVEYVPRPVLTQMVERRPPRVDSNALSRAENTVSRTDTGVSPDNLDNLSALQKQSANGLRSMVRRMPHEQARGFMSYQNSFGKTAIGVMPEIAMISKAIAPLIFQSRAEKQLISETNRQRSEKQETERRDEISFEQNTNLEGKDSVNNLGSRRTPSQRPK